MKNTIQTTKELTITRIFNANPAVVFKAWTDPKQLEKWWGPEGFTNPVCKVDARPGGSIYIEMQAPDGTIYPMKGEFNEIEEPKRLVFTSAALDKDGNPLFEVLTTVTFTEEVGKTKFTMHASVIKVISGEAEQYIAGMDEGWNQSLERLERQVAKIKNTPFVIERTFNAPAAKVWKAITDKDEMKQWYFDLKEFKPEVGFKFQFSAGNEEGKQYLHMCTVTDIIAGKKISYSWRYDGYEGNSFVTFELLPEGDKTKLRLTHEGLETFPASNPDLAKENFAKGWTQIIGTALKEFIDSSSK